MTESIEKIELHGFEKNEQANLLVLTLENWIKLVKRYAGAHDEDATYWYNERATLSVFAAAVWQDNKCCAIEEYANKKSNKLRAEKNGRCDLYMQLDDTSYACEAKQSWQKVVPKGKGNLETTLDVIKLANDATREIRADEADVRLSLTFCIPYFQKKALQQHSNLDDAITSNIEEFCTELNNIVKNNQYLCDGVAYVFPKQSRLLQTEDGVFYPGAVLLIKKINKGYRAKTNESSNA